MELPQLNQYVHQRVHQVALAKCDLTEYLLQTLATKYDLSQAEILFILSDVASTTAQYAVRDERAKAEKKAKKAKK